MQERVFVRVLGVHHMNLDRENEQGLDVNYGIWAYHCSPFRVGGDLPIRGDWVWVMFDEEDPLHCVWFGFVKGTVQLREDQKLEIKGNELPVVKGKRMEASE